jgi:hypothetical protein
VLKRLLAKFHLLKKAVDGKVHEKTGSGKTGSK